MTATRLIAIDWGTTSARAYFLGGNDGAIARERSEPLGVQRIGDRQFPDALKTLCGGELPDVPMLACGMIGSRQGWVEAPYRECPASFDSIAKALTAVPGTRLAIVPGLICRDAAAVPDVMRGEETQIVGALPESRAGRQVIVLPGTHSKWAIVASDGIESFATFMTGEMYAVLREHSILGRLAAPGSDVMAFERGVRHSLRERANLSHDLFSARTLALAGPLAPEGVADYLSGLLLGAEIAAAREWLANIGLAGATVTLVGDDTLCRRYAQALMLAAIDSLFAAPAAAARGLWRIAVAANWVT